LARNEAVEQCEPDFSIDVGHRRCELAGCHLQPACESTDVRRIASFIQQPTQKVGAEHPAILVKQI
jgi:hypothetical protein